MRTQRVGQAPRDRLPHARATTPAHAALPAPHQRKGRTIHPHDARRLGLRRDLHRLRGAHPSAPRLAQLLQSPTTTRLPQPPTAHPTAGGTHQEQRAWVLQRVLGARVLAEFGDAPNRYKNGKHRRCYAGTAPITRASGTRHVVLARFIRNRRLADACYL